VAGNSTEEVAPRTQTRHDMVEAHAIKNPNIGSKSLGMYNALKDSTVSYSVANATHTPDKVYEVKVTLKNPA